MRRGGRLAIALGLLVTGSGVIRRQGSGIERPLAPVRAVPSASAPPAPKPAAEPEEVQGAASTAPVEDVELRDGRVRRPDGSVLAGAWVCLLEAPREGGPTDLAGRFRLPRR